MNTREMRHKGGQTSYTCAVVMAMVLSCFTVVGTVKAQSDAPKSLLASSTVSTGFHPALDLSPVELETIINAKNPYTLYRKGSMLEYCMQHKGERTHFLGYGPTYIRQIVDDERIENGVLVAYVRQEFYNKKHAPLKGLPASFKSTLFPTEIDTAGTYHLTHNIAEDHEYVLHKRSGYGLLIPGDFIIGTHLECSTLNDVTKGGFGNIIKVKTEYNDWKVEGQEQITTPAGTFDCVKICGRINKDGFGIFEAAAITCWLSRGIGVVQYEIINNSDKKKVPYVIFLNKADLK